LKEEDEEGYPETKIWMTNRSDFARDRNITSVEIVKMGE